MEAYPGSQTCELVNLYMIFLTKDFKINMGICRDDSLAVTKESSRSCESTKQKLCKLVSENGLKIDIKSNLDRVDILDVT